MSNPYDPPLEEPNQSRLSRWRYIVVGTACFFMLGYLSILFAIRTGDYSTPDSLVSDNMRLGRRVLAAWFYTLPVLALGSTLWAALLAYRGRWIRALVLIFVTFASLRLLSRFGTPLMLDAFEWFFPL